MPDVRDEMVFHKWVTQDSACDTCLELQGIYPTIPQRPHPVCRCRIVSYNSKPAGGRCLWDEPIELSTHTSYYYGDQGVEPETEFSTDEEGNNEATYFMVMEVLCPDASIIMVTVSYLDEDRDFDQVYSESSDLSNFADTVIDEMRRECLELAKSECPRCLGPAQF